MRYEEIAKHIERGLKSLGDPFDSQELLKDTAKRLARVWLEMSEGIRQPPPELR